ncbi:hypothetical protein BCR34DRAFT_666459, partial [Clohesyomyces aquaticus]
MLLAANYICLLAGKVCIITGASSGFEESISKRFILEGANVVIAEINESAGKRFEKEIASISHPGSKGQVLLVHTDVTSKQSWGDLMSKTLDRSGKLDIVLNNVGTTYVKKPSHEVTERGWQMLIDINMKSTYQVRPLSCHTS